MDGWNILKIETEEGPLYKVFAGYAGGYATGDGWTMNSGIETYEEENVSEGHKPDYVLFHGYSGSTRKCFLNSEGVRPVYSWSVMMDYIEKSEGRMSLISYEDFKKEWAMKEMAEQDGKLI